MLRKGMSTATFGCLLGFPRTALDCSLCATLHDATLLYDNEHPPNVGELFFATANFARASTPPSPDSDVIDRSVML